MKSSAGTVCHSRPCCNSLGVLSPPDGTPSGLSGRPRGFSHTQGIPAALGLALRLWASTALVSFP